MANYVLVHGGDRDGSIWKDVAKKLELKGHLVYSPSMTSVKKTTLQENINEVNNFIYEGSIENIILCGQALLCKFRSCSLSHTA